MRIGPMGYVVPLYHPLRLAEEIALVDQIVGGRMELGLVPGINPDYFKPFGLDYNLRKSPTLEFVEYLRAAYGEKQPFSFHGDVHHTDSAQLAVPPLQKPHPPLWMMSRDPQTLEFCAKHGINPGYFLVYPRADAAPRYRKFLADWTTAGWPQPPKIAYCTIVLRRRVQTRKRSTSRWRARPAPMKVFYRRQSRARRSNSACASTPRNSSAAVSRALPRSWPTCSMPTT